MQQIKDVERLNLRELQDGTPLESSWHAQYRGCNYVNIGGLPFALTEGDLECMMSQFGTVTDLKLARNDETNESRGFAWVQYADW
jgi:RNA-binding motif protein, X-linked 2